MTLVESNGRLARAYTPSTRITLDAKALILRDADRRERWRFLADHALTLHTDGGDYGYLVHCCRTAGPGQLPKFYPVSNGRTPEEAIDRAIARYNRKHTLSLSPEFVHSGAVMLPVRGTVS